MVTKKDKKYNEALSYLYGLEKYGIKFGLSKTSNLLESLGNPHLGQKYVHVAGTNGKGSVSTFIASILMEAGLKVGFYSSPHLVRFTERFRINGEEISQKDTCDLVNEIKSVAVHEEPPTYFEATTAMALTYFAREHTDISIMEVGMGGRLDATNIVTPLVSIITNISLEHQMYLGTRLLEIAYEKAGIIKKEIDVVSGVKQTSVKNLMKNTAEKNNAPICQIGTDARYRKTSSGFNYYGIKRKLNGLTTGLIGDFQIRNATISIAAIEKLEAKGIRISSDHIRKGLKNSIWPGRMQIISRSPVLLLDGAHNTAAMRALADSIKKNFRYNKLILVIGIMKDKEIKEILENIVPIADYIFYTRPVYDRAANPEILFEKAAHLHKPGQIVQQLTNALENAKEMAEAEDMIVVCGSLFTVGEALSYLDPEKYGPDIQQKTISLCN